MNEFVRSSLDVEDLLSDELRNPPRQTRLFVRASVECRVETQWGDTVVMCGSTEQLGCWRPERAIRLATDQTIYPVWRAEPLLLHADEIEFKFVILRANSSVEWEPLPHNRRVALAQGMEEVQVVADWGSPSVSPFAAASNPTPTLRSPTQSRAMPGAPSTSPASSMHGHGLFRPTDGSTSDPASRAEPRRQHSEPEDDPSSRPDPALVERLLVVMHHLPLKIKQEADGAWRVEWDESSLLSTSVQGGRHLLGALNLEVIFVGAPPRRPPPAPIACPPRPKHLHSPRPTIRHHPTVCARACCVLSQGSPRRRCRASARARWPRPVPPSTACPSSCRSIFRARST